MAKRRQLAAILTTVQKLKRQIVDADEYFPSSMHVLRLEEELQAKLRIEDASFNFGKNVPRVFMGAHYALGFQAPFFPLKCFHKNELTLDGPAAPCGCRVETVVHDEVTISQTKQKR